MKFRNLILATAGLLFFGFTSLAQITAIEGDVKGDDGKPLVGAVVKIDRTDITAHYKTKTDKKGHYFYNGLPLGNYNVTVEVDGKDVDQTEGREVEVGRSHQRFFRLAGFQEDPRRGSGRDAEGRRKRPAHQGDGARHDRRAEGRVGEDPQGAGRAVEAAQGVERRVQRRHDGYADKQYDQAVRESALTKASEIGPRNWPFGPTWRTLT